MLLGVLARAANAIDLIVQRPIEFLGNLVNAVKTGVLNFGANIVEHLKTGLKGWLLGNLADAGIEIPEALDAKGILRMVLSVLGLTWASVRARILRFVPEPVLKVLEGTVDVVKTLVTEGLPGLWRWVIEKLGDLKEMVLGEIKEFVVEKIVQAGITWIISLLNPAAAFIKACKAIYDIVMFFVERAAQIKEFVDSVLDSIESIARGGVGAVAGLIEKTLARAVPLVIGFLANLLGLGGISEKIRGVLEKIQAPVGKVIDMVVGTVVKAGKKLLGKLGKKKTGDTDTSKAVKKKAHDMVSSAASTKFTDRAGLNDVLRNILGTLRPEGLTSLTAKLAEDRPGHYTIMATASPEEQVGEVEVSEGDTIKLAEEVAKASEDAGSRRFLFRGDDEWREGTGVGLPIGSEEAAEADIQTPWEHVREKQGEATSRYVSFSEIIGSAKGGAAKFTRKDVIAKAVWEALLDLKKKGVIQILEPQDVEAMMKAEKPKIRKLAGDVRTIMEKNREVLIEGRIPAEYLSRAKR
jgi:hypothetical protein